MWEDMRGNKGIVMRKRKRWWIRGIRNVEFIYINVSLMLFVSRKEVSWGFFPLFKPTYMRSNGEGDCLFVLEFRKSSFEMNNLSIIRIRRILKLNYPIRKIYNGWSRFFRKGCGYRTIISGNFLFAYVPI